MARSIVAKPSRGITSLDKNRERMFSFQIRMLQDLDRPVPIKNGHATLQGSVSHSDDKEVMIAPETRGKVNLGARLYSEDKQQLIFETRLFSHPRALPPKTWIPVQVSIPREPITMGTSYVLSIDFVREFKYWFSDKGGDAYEHLVVFGDGPAADPLQRLDELERAFASIHNDINTLRSQLPRLLNAISAANAAASIVGQTKNILSPEDGEVALALQRLTYEVQSLWQAYDIIAKQLDPGGPAANFPHPAKPNPRRKGFDR
jgi:hypothetical protein